MTKPVHTRTFKSGNSVALRLPRGLSVEPGDRFEVSRHGDTLTARRIPTPEEEAERLARFRVMLAEMRKLPRPAKVQDREPFEFPDRPGL